MDQELKAKWVAALRSGEIKQAEGHLLTEDGAMCCLGVLGSVLGIPREDLAHWSTYLGAQGKSAPTLQPLDDCGLSLEARSRLADKNDGTNGQSKHSFSEIADFIEGNL
jgi:hypothetical protein